MLLQLKSLFLGDESTLPVDYELDLSDVDVRGLHPFADPVSVKGDVTNRAGIVTLRAVVSYWYSGVCDRCAEPIHRSQQLNIEHILVTALSDEENDDFLLVENDQLPLDELVQADLILSLPIKTLCKPDCRGLCPQCGKNLNEGPCNCKKESVDPRLEVLKQLIQ